MRVWTERDTWRFMDPRRVLICGDVGTTILYDPKPDRIIVLTKIGPDLYRGTSFHITYLQVWQGLTMELLR